MDTQAANSRKIIARKRGNRLGFWFFKTALRWFGLRGAYGLLHFVCPYYLLFDTSARTTALAYFRRRFRSRSLLRLLPDVYRLFVSQGRNLIDRYYAISGLGSFAFETAGFDRLQDVLARPEQGFVLLLCHAGNWQVAMNALPKLDRPVCALMRPEDNPAVQQSLRIGSSGTSFRVISPEQELGGMVELLAALQDGEIVLMMGDRGYGFKTATVPFLGDPAAFACGAFTLAAAARCPVVPLLSAKSGTRDYRLEIPAVYAPRYVPGRRKAEQLRDWVAAYAALLEEYVQRHPHQFFLFHDVWASAGTQERPG